MQNRGIAQSPVDTLIDLKVGCGLRRQIQVWLDFDPVICLRVAVIPQRWSVRRGNVRGVEVHPDVIEDPSLLRHAW